MESRSGACAICSIVHDQSDTRQSLFLPLSTIQCHFLAQLSCQSSGMTTALIATVLSILREQNCSLDVTNPCILDRDDSEGSLASGSCGANIAPLPEDSSHLTGDVSLVARSSPLRPANSASEQETSGPERNDPRFSRRNTLPLRSKETPEACTLYTGTDAIEDRCARHRQELQELTREARQQRPEPPRAHESSDDRVAEILDLTFESYNNITSEARERRRRSMRSTGLAAEPRVPSIKRSRQRALDLDINGTPRFKLNSNNNTTTRPKLVRLQNRWRRVGRR